MALLEDMTFRLRQGRAKLQTKLSPRASIFDVAQVALKYWGDTHDAVIAVAVAGAESGYRLRAMNAAKNGTDDHGMWQINAIHRPDMRVIYDLDYNASVAYKVWQQRARSKPWFDGWRAWNAYLAKKHLPFMEDARLAIEAVKEDRRVEG